MSKRAAVQRASVDVCPRLPCAYGWLACGSGGAIALRAMLFQAICEPNLNFLFYPAHGAQANAHPTRESSFGFELIDHGASEAGDLTDLRKTKNLYGRCSSSGLSGHGGDSNVWFR
jgi:hypothetical protein